MSDEEKKEGMNILDHKSVNFRKWLDAIVKKRGIDSTLTVKQIYKMVDFLDRMEERLDDTIIKALG